MRKIILIVEDDMVVRKVIRGVFQQEYNVLEASRCSRALELLRHHVDIALIDYMLPDGDGFEVLKESRKVKPDLPIILMTGYSTEDVAIKALRFGATDYVKKPLVLGSLQRRVSDILEGENRELAEDSVQKEDFIMDGVAAFLEEKYSTEVTRDLLAKKVCMNKHRFSRVFNRRFGRSLKSYLNDIRVKRATELLRNNRDLSMADIAGAVGYRNIVHFDRVFKEVYGMSPKEYRQNTVRSSQGIGYLWFLE
jgi:YesN/AraC family two-component response regulator